jgi:hypothetical protein
VPADTKKTAPPAPNPDVQGKFGPGAGTFRTCLRGDDSPEGTVTDGFRKVVAPTPMGQSCHWEKVQ